MLLVLGAFAAFAVGGRAIARRARDPFALLIAFGMTALIVVPAIVNAAVVMGLAPTKGFTLPFLSLRRQLAARVRARGRHPAARCGAARPRPRSSGSGGGPAPAGLGMTAADEKLRWVVAGGGTGGHVTPALALAERIAARGDEVLLLGTERGLERGWCPRRASSC